MRPSVQSKIDDTAIIAVQEASTARLRQYSLIVPSKSLIARRHWIHEKGETDEVKRCSKIWD